MKMVILESPLAGNVEENLKYAREAMLDCLKRDESPMVSHLLYTQVLDDTVPREREQGIAAGLAWLPAVDYTVVYTDLGISPGMARGIKSAILRGVPVEYRKIRP